MLVENANQNQAAVAGRFKRGGRRWVFRLTAIFLGLAPLLLIEIALRLTGWPTQSLPLDPYLDLHNLRPLFQTSAEAPGVLQIPEERLHLFNEARFQRLKPDNGFRVFALGGSTTYGEPYTAPTAFPKWLEIYLQSAAPEMQVEVVNCGGLSYASYRVLAILNEVLQYDPDLIVVYSGHNEYLERRSYGDTDSWHPLATILGWTSQLKIVQAIRLQLSAESDSASKGRESPSPERTAMAAEVDALLDYRGGLKDYRRSTAWMERVPEHFEWNLRAMQRLCQQAGVGLLVIKPVSNLKDCPPFKMEAAPNLQPDQLLEFEQVWEAARTAATASDAVASAERALAIDSDHAGANFLLGRQLLVLGETSAAAQALVRAKDGDVCPLRAPSPILAAVERVCGGGKLIPMVDAERLFSDLSPQGIVGDEWLVDHIHPSVDGHQLLGEAIAQRAVDQGWLPAASADWLKDGRESARLHLASLGEEYYHRGKQRLEGLRLWTQGRAKKVRNDSD